MNISSLGFWILITLALAITFLWMRFEKNKIKRIVKKEINPKNNPPKVFRNPSNHFRFGTKKKSREL